MKATFSAREPNILMEAQPDDLFTPLGPDLVECVCAVRTIGDGNDRDTSHLDPDVRLVVVVIACRVEKGEPEYYPTGFTTSLVGATPISFLEQVEPAAFRERTPKSDTTMRAAREASLAERVRKYEVDALRVTPWGYARGGYVPCAPTAAQAVPPGPEDAGPTLADCASREERQISRL